ncbi:MAG TPA: hypothetical protein VFM63_16170 [Pyrinomonadaceae bacterium]|nr:hypothetical protein [Pyrinomonadaceae bacterium]
MFTATKRLSLSILCILALFLLMSSGENPRVARASGFVGYDLSYAGECFYWDPQLQQELGAARYQYTNWRHTAADTTVRYFTPMTILYSGVCSDDVSTGTQWSADGWKMVINTPYNVTVYNSSNQQIYP